MNDKKICFIACVNNDKYEQEMLNYISLLVVPDGYEIDYLSIRNSTSMCAGYNEGMQSTDAKYKVYLHQDTFIINPNFLLDILSIFKNPQIGMLGLVGSPILPDNCIMWTGPRVGKVFKSTYYSTHVNEPDPAQFPGGIDCTPMENIRYQDVQAVDGFLIATQTDVPWREDIFTHYDFYDISQSSEMRKAGFRVVVPYQNMPWCMHDDGFLNLSFYEDERKKYIENYRPDSLFQTYNHNTANIDELLSKVKAINKLLIKHDKESYLQIGKYVNNPDWFEPVRESNEFAALKLAESIFAEEQSKCLNRTIFDVNDNIDELIEYLFDFRMLLFRISFNRVTNDDSEIRGYIKNHRSLPLLWKGLSCFAPSPKKASFKLFEIFEELDFQEESLQMLLFMDVNWPGNIFFNIKLADKLSNISQDKAVYYLNMIPKDFWVKTPDEQSRYLTECINDWVNE